MSRILVVLLWLSFTLPGLGQSATVEVWDSFEPTFEESIPVDLLESSSLPRPGVHGSASTSASTGSSAGMMVWKYDGLVKPWFDNQDWNELVQEVIDDNWTVKEIKNEVTLQGTVQSKVEGEIGIADLVKAKISFEASRFVSVKKEYVAASMARTILRLDAVMHTCLFAERGYVLGVATTCVKTSKAYMAKGTKFTLASGSLPPKG